MVLANNIFAKHDSSQSSEQNFKTQFYVVQIIFMAICS